MSTTAAEFAPFSDEPNNDRSDHRLLPASRIRARFVVSSVAIAVLVAACGNSG